MQIRVVKYGNDKTEYQKDNIIMSIIEELVPQEHNVSKLDLYIDWDFVKRSIHLFWSIGHRFSVTF